MTHYSVDGAILMTRRGGMIMNDVAFHIAISDFRIKH